MYWPSPVRRETLDGFRLRVPGAHQPATARANELVELPAACAHCLGGLRGQLRKDRVRFCREHDAHAGDFLQPRLQQLRHCIRVTPVAQPDVVIQQSEPRRGNEAHFRSQLAGLLQTVGKIVGERAVEEHHRLTDGQTVLGPAEAQHVDARAPRDLGRMHVERGNRVREPRAVHVHFQMTPFGDRRDRAHLLDGIDRAYFRRLGQRDDLRLRVVNIGAARDDRFDRIRRELAANARRGQQLGAAREEFGAAAFIGFDVREFMADHRVV